MSMQLQDIINQLRAEGEDYSNFKTLLAAISKSGAEISKDEILDFVVSDYRIQLHTTPNSISKLVARIAGENRPHSAIDICCGTGNILYYLQNEIDDLTGVEIVENVAELTKYFIPDLHIITADTFAYPFQQKYDLVVGNIPFGMRVEMGGKRILGEEAFLRKAFELLTENGRAVILVPYSVLSSDNLKNFRMEYINYLEEIVALPAGSIRNTHMRSAIIVLNKKSADSVKLSILNQFDNLCSDYESAENIVCSKEQLKERWDPEFVILKENSFYKELEGFETKELQELAEIVKGKLIPADTLKAEGDYLYLKPGHIKNGSLNLESGLKYISRDALGERDLRCLLLPGDIIVSTIFNDLKMYVYTEEDAPSIASHNLAIIRTSKQDYILSYLQTEEGKRVFKTQAEDLKKGAVIPHLTLKDLGLIRIPILPVADLNSLGDMGISHSTEKELQEALKQLEEYKIRIESLENEKSNLTELRAFVKNRFDKVESQLEVVSKKLDDLLSILKELKVDFKIIQQLPREDEEKLFKLCQKIDAKLDDVYRKEKQTIEGYIEEIKRWLDLWENLDVQSQKFLPIAEFIFDELSKLDDANYAPFVVQYCRTLENEILKKLFEAYHTQGLIGVDREELVLSDLLKKTTGKFAEMVRKNRMTYTLGDMSFIMALLKQGGNSLNESPLLQHFRDFTISYFDKQIVEADFLNDVDKITKEYRNKAAHPYSINIELAQDCKKLLRKSLNVFLESVRGSNNK